MKDEENNPVSGAIVSLSETLTGTTGSAGGCSINNVLAGDYNLNVTAEGYEIYSDIITVNSDFDDVNITLESISYNVSGVVVNEDEQPLNNVDIMLDGRLITLTGVDGSYIINNVNKGTHTIQIPNEVSRDYEDFSKEIEIIDTDITQNITLLYKMTNYTPTIKGANYETGEKPPLDGVTVTIEEVGSEISDENGNVTFSLKNGEYTITLEKTGYITQTETLNCPYQLIDNFVMLPEE